MLTKPRYAILIAPPADTPDAPEAELQVEVLYGDQLRAELEAPRHGLAKIGDAPQHAVLLWVWASLTRTHVIDQPFQEFMPRVLILEAVKDPAGDPLQVTVHPTKGSDDSP